MSEKKKVISLHQRRKLLRGFRKQYGITLTAFGALAGLSQPMLSQFESGVRNLSAEAWARVLAAMDKAREWHEDPKVFRDRRKRLGLTQHQLAKISGVSYEIIANVEGGRRRLIGDVAKSLWEALAQTWNLRQKQLQNTGTKIRELYR